MGKLITIYKNISLKKALVITTTVSLLLGFVAALLIVIITRPSYYKLISANTSNTALYLHDIFTVLAIINIICIRLRKMLYFKRNYLFRSKRD